MKSLIDDDTLPTRRAPCKKKVPRTAFLSGLHKLLSQGLPDFVDAESGDLDVRKVAKLIGISHQAMYKWFERDNIPSKRIGMIVTLSKKSTNIPTAKPGAKPWKPLIRDDFWEFMAQ